MKHKSLLFSTWFSTLGAPTLVAGSVGGGIKLYLRNFSGNLDGVSLPLMSNFSEVNPKVVDVIATFKSEIEKRNKKIIDENTDSNKAKVALLHVLNPNISTPHHVQQNSLFNGNSAFTLNTHQIASGRLNNEDFVVSWLEQPSTSIVNKYKRECKKALDQPYDQSKNVDELNKLLKWCTVIETNKDLLERNDFTLLDTDVDQTKDDNDWKTIISGGWFTKGDNVNYWDYQKFIIGSDLETLVGKADAYKEIKKPEEVTTDQIKLFKNKCKQVLGEAPEVKNFYLSNYFLSGAKEPKSKLSVDSFYEATFFCTKPIKAEDYVTKTLNRNVHKDKIKQGLVCSIQEDTYDFYTYQPAKGKGFWCGVKVLYGTSKYK
ncbi:hypothetical protein [Candidatus Mycoplasma haematohominis]|uniref:hypothetical protein n=1 Tax=Candidatus Mycoplasma haematohominis TaxID=1494318 RepID=UPI001C0A6C89|nr:hypothetical protein [Candidatus Mycoplasma haemohominis]